MSEKYFPYMRHIDSDYSGKWFDKNTIKWLTNENKQKKKLDTGKF